MSNADDVFSPFSDLDDYDNSSMSDLEDARCNDGKKILEFISFTCVFYVLSKVCILSLNISN